MGNKVQTAALVFLLLGQQSLTAEQAPAPLPNAPQQVSQQAPLPDAPAPAALPVQDVTPGVGSSSAATGTPKNSAPDAPLASNGGPDAPATAPAADVDTPPETVTSKAFTLVSRTNFVEVPFTVKDSKNRLVPGLTSRDVRIYENGLRQQARFWTVDPFPLSVALVIDQSLQVNTMSAVNNSLTALQGAFSPYDEIAVFTYNNGPRMQTDFTAAQGARVTQVLERSKTAGREMVFADTTGPLSQNINMNGGANAYADPNTNSSHGTNMAGIQNVPKEVHTLNDAILMAATSLVHTPKERKRVIYVISDGKELGSKAKQKDVIKVLQQNRIAVYATIVGDSSEYGMGFLDRIHLPFQMRDDVLPQYAAATGGGIDPEFRQKGIEQSFQKITEEVRTQYMIGYYSHEPFIDGKYRKLEVQVLRPNLTVIAKDGYYPSAEQVTQAPAPQKIKP